MKKWIVFALLFLVVAKVGLNPLARDEAEETLIDEVGTFETEISRQPNGVYRVSALTPMPGVRAEMVKWWFTDFLQTTEHYKWWHPTDHVWMDWENKVPGEIVGASHLVHEYIGGEMQELRIQFVDPTEIFGFDPNDEDTFVLCARTGVLKESVNVGRMCHIIRNTPDGAEMRSRFWLGYVAKRDGNEVVGSALGLVGNSALLRLFAVDAKMADGLKVHATEEMAFLAALLPDLFETSQ